MTRREAAAAVVLVATAAGFALGVLPRRASDDLSLVAYDFYGQFYPYVVHALRSLRTGGGLLWNPYQDCGQPFFGNSQTGLLYPVTLLFAVLPREPALLASVVVNLVIAAAGMYLLCRALRLTPIAALCGALAFQLGTATLNLAAWSPTHIAPYAWLPVALWRTERLIVSPSLRRGLLLALVLAIQLLPGFPQTVFFTYQLIALRVAWALLWRQAPAARALLGPLAVGLVMPVLLVAVQLLPALEVARESVRQQSVSAQRLGPGFSWGLLGQVALAQMATPGSALIAVLSVYGVAASRRLGRGLEAAFYAAVAIVYVVLSVGPGTPLFALYERLPLGSMFRAPARLLWITSFALAVLVALGAEAVAARVRSPSQRAGAALPSIAAAAIAVGLVIGAGAELGWTNIAALAAAVLILVVPLPEWAAGAAPLALAALIACDTVVAGRPPLFGIRSGDVYGEQAEVLGWVGERLTPQDRVLLVGSQPMLGLMPKSATLFALPSIHDYDALAARRYAEYFTFLRTGRRMADFEDWYWLFGKLLPAGLRRPLFDQTAARFVVVAVPLDQTARALPGSMRLLLERDGVRVYENERALPRARYVPRVTVRPDGQVLPSLATGAVADPGVVIVAREDAAALGGSGDGGEGTVEFVADEPERVVLRVTATAPGFVFLADEYFPGWTATVKGEPRSIVRANHTFRLVAVPAGQSEVVFTYRPLSLRLGAAVSLAAVIAFAVLWRRTSPQRRRDTEAFRL